MCKAPQRWRTSEEGARIGGLSEEGQENLEGRDGDNAGTLLDKSGPAFLHVDLCEDGLLGMRGAPQSVCVDCEVVALQGGAGRLAVGFPTRRTLRDLQRITPRFTAHLAVASSKPVELGLHGEALAAPGSEELDYNQLAPVVRSQKSVKFVL